VSIAIRGRVVAAGRHRVEAELPAARIGDRVRIAGEGRSLEADVVAIAANRVVVALLDAADCVGCGDRVELEGPPRAILGVPLIGRAVDARGDAIDGGPPPLGARALVDAERLEPHRRAPLRGVLWTGVRAVDGLFTIARGARVGIFGSAGCGKSILLEQIARRSRADAIVYALVGERGGEVRRRLDRLDRRTTLICAPADAAPGAKIAAGELALAQAEHLRARGLEVLTVFDSLARYAHAAREVALASGEPAGRGGYPPSVFARLAALVERAGSSRLGSITLLGTVLSEEGDAANDPLAEAARSVLDGHLVLSRSIAERARFPALNVPASLSRTMSLVAGAKHAADATRVRDALARLSFSSEARELGIASPDAALARAVAAEATLEGFLRQGEEACSPDETLRRLGDLADTL